MDELILINEKFNTVSKKLNTELNGIITAYNNGQKAGEKIAKHLTAIKDGELWKTGDNDSIEINGTICTKFEDVAGVFGIGRQYAYKLTKAYTLKYNTDGLTDRLANFTLSQITEMARLNVTDIMVLIDEESITANMTLKAIRDVVDAYKKKDEEIPDEEETTETGDNNDIEVGDDLPEDDGHINGVMYIHLNGVDYEIDDKKTIDKIMKLIEK